MPVFPDWMIDSDGFDESIERILHSMKKHIPALLLAVLLLLMLAIFSVAVTVLLFPFWSWLETFSGIESVGHSGPASWCYLLVFLLLLVVSAAAVVLRTLIRRDQKSSVA